MPDHTMEELELCNQAVFMGEDKAGVERLYQTLGVRVKRSTKKLETNEVVKFDGFPVKTEIARERKDNKIGVRVWV